MSCHVTGTLDTGPSQDCGWDPLHSQKGPLPGLLASDCCFHIFNFVFSSGPQKGHGYHLDLMVLSVLIFICAMMGLPWFVAATVRAVTHVRSLIKESDLRAPGERPQFLGVRLIYINSLFISISKISKYLAIKNNCTLEISSPKYM